MMAQLQQEKDRLNLAPKKFNMWIFIFTSFMFFAAFTSGFIVYAGGKGHGLNVILPQCVYIQYCSYYFKQRNVVFSIKGSKTVGI